MLNQTKERLVSAFTEYFGSSPEYIFSAPGRTELGGNHTDHQRGKVLAAAVDLETAAAVRRNAGPAVRVFSEGFGLSEIALSDLEPVPEEQGTTVSIIRGTLACLKQHGFEPEGFDAYVISSVLPGSGLSSSASFEVLMGAIMNGLFCNDSLTQKELAVIGQRVENVYFGKPSGLMDQTACAVGGILSIDFQVPGEPAIEKLDFDFTAHGYALCIINVGADHAELTPEYAAIPGELSCICRYFHKEVLREISEEEFYGALPELRQCAGDRAVLRAMHVFNENRRVTQQVEALKAGDLEAFLYLVRESGLSSWRFLQNVVPVGRTKQQEVAFALASAERFLNGAGACRVHGGGFAGTIQAFVPLEQAEAFRSRMDNLLGSGACMILSVSDRGCGLAEIL